MRRIVARRARQGFVAGIVLFAVPFFWFAPVILGGRTLVPADNIYQFQPWAAQAAALGVGTPHNELLSDLVLENYVWKTFLRRTLAAGELPLWNPYIFSGVPFLAAGQHSALYPLSLLFFLLPLPLAYGVFTWLQFGLAGLGMYAFGRSLRLSHGGSLLAGLAFQFSGFYVVSVVFTMIIAAAAWLPWLLAAIETVVHKQEEKGNVSYSPAPYALGAAVAVGLQGLAGHPEILVITLLAAGLYTLLRLAIAWRRLGSPRRPAVLAVWLLAAVLLGLALGAAQVLPLYELVSTSFREGSASYAEVVGWAWPTRQLLTFVLPDVFGNPSHHGWFDPWQWAWRPAGPNAAGQPVATVFWGVKNYVEGGNYLGLLTLLLVAVAVARVIIGRGRDGDVPPEAAAAPEGQGRAEAALLILLAVISLLFAFGTPLYALLFYGVPGYKQLHSAFRWVFPYTVAMAALAGMGLDGLRAWAAGGSLGVGARLAAALGVGSLLVGLAALAAAGLSVAWPGPFVALGQRVVDASDLARAVFADGRDFWGYQWRNVLHLGAFSLLAGLWLLLALRNASPWRRYLPAAAMALVVLDLYGIFGRFNPAADAALLKVTPPSVAFLQQERDRSLAEGDVWRLTTFEGPGTTKTFNANLPWLHGLQDVRGYDSIIPRQYVAYMQAIEPQGQLLYNRISPFYDPASLEDPLTDLLGVRYAMTELTLDLPGWEPVYAGEVNVYRNADALPRAFVADEAVVVPTAEAVERARAVDPRRVVVLDEDALQRPEIRRLMATWAEPWPPPPASPQLRTAAISRYDTRQVFVDLNLSDRGWLVLTDAWFPGWRAYLRPFGVVGEGVDAEGKPLEQELPVFRAYGNFRAVYIPAAGQWTVRFIYSPRSVQLGIYTSFLAAVVLFLVAGWWAWGRYYRESGGAGAEVRTVAKNSVVQMVLSLTNRGIDFAFAMLRMRVLGPAGEGSFAFVIAIYGFFEVVVRFGLGTLMTRDVAQDRRQAGRYLVNVVALRSLLWLLSLPLIALVAGFYARTGNLSAAEGQALALFTAALFFASLADSISAVFYAYEKMEYPAGIATAIATGKVALGALVLLPPFEWGFVGLAGVSLVMNVVQTVWLWAVLRRHVPLELGRPERPLQRTMAVEAYPLMLNHLLASIFWRIDLWLLKPLAGTAAVGIYSAGVKYLDGLNVIPSYFTLAIFPLMSRYAKDSRDSLVRAYWLAVRLLEMIALPVAITVTALATPLIRILGGSAFLPDSAIALTLLIWSIPIGFINSVTQYVLIAVGQQRFLTKAFLIGVAFNVIANLILIPRLGYRGAAITTILSEFSLFFPFYYAVRRHLAPVPWVDLLWRQWAAAGAMALVTWWAARWSVWPAVALGWAAYGLALVALGAFRDPDMQRVRRALPLGRRRRPAADPVPR
ncbi:MAG: flippase [Anaerolineae bacterium]|nr:flippase [Anaerolineae bacterium]